MPKVTEVYPSGLHSPKAGFLKENYFITNLNLSHETSQNKEVGIKLEKSFGYLDKLTFKTSYYKNDIKDYIKIERLDRYVMEEQNGTSQFINVDNVSIQGLEAKLNYSYDIYDLGISYSKVRGKNLDEDLYLEDLPADEYVYTFKVFLEKYNTELGYNAIQTRDQNRVNPQTTHRTQATPGYFIQNVFANMTFNDSLDLGIRINNLGNVQYRRHASYINESAQDIRFSLKYRVNTL